MCVHRVYSLEQTLLIVSLLHDQSGIELVIYHGHGRYILTMNTLNIETMVFCVYMASRDFNVSIPWFSPETFFSLTFLLCSCSFPLETIFLFSLGSYIQSSPKLHVVLSNSNYYRNNGKVQTFPFNYNIWTLTHFFVT
jgi:hypothetical protein